MSGGWLVLGRTVGQAVVLTLPDGRECRVVLNESRAGFVRLAFRCPPDVRIMREEIAQPKAQTVREVWP